LTACAEGWRATVGFAEDEPSMVTEKLNSSVFYTL